MRNTLEGDVDLWWARDMGFGWPQYIRDDQQTIDTCLALKDEAVAIWQEICALADQIAWPDEELGAAVPVPPSPAAPSAFRFRRVRL